MQARFPNNYSGMLDYLTAAKWLSESFHNAWLKNMPTPEMMTELIELQKKELKGEKCDIEERVVNWETQESSIAWAGLLKRTTKNAIHMKKGLRSGERNTDLTNTLLNRTQFQIVEDDVKNIFKGILKEDCVVE